MRLEELEKKCAHDMKIEGRIEFTIVKHELEQVISEMPVQPGILNPYD